MKYEQAEEHFRNAQRATLAARDALRAAEISVIRSQQALAAAEAAEAALLPLVKAAYEAKRAEQKA